MTFWLRFVFPQISQRSPAFWWWKKTVLTDFEFTEIIDVHRELMHVFGVFAHQIERQADGLSRSNGRQIRQFIGDVLDRFRKLHHKAILARFSGHSEFYRVMLSNAKHPFCVNKERILRFAQNDGGDYTKP